MKKQREVAKQEPGWESSRTWRETCASGLARLLICFELQCLVTLRSAGVSLHHYSLDKNESKSHFMSCVSLLQIPRGLVYFGHICLELPAFVGVVSFVAAQV